VHVTVASAAGGEVAPGSDLHANLAAAVDAFREGSERVVIDSFTPRLFRVAAGLRTDPRRVAADVLAAAAGALREAFSFAARSFAQPVTGAEVIAALQGVDGVVSVDLDALELTGAGAAGSAGAVAAAIVLPARSTRWSGSAIQPSELLLLDPDGVTLHEVSA
jgi:hypothetical protein